MARGPVKPPVFWVTMREGAPWWFILGKCTINCGQISVMGWSVWPAGHLGEASGLGGQLQTEVSVPCCVFGSPATGTTIPAAQGPGSQSTTILHSPGTGESREGTGQWGLSWNLAPAGCEITAPTPSQEESQEDWETAAVSAGSWLQSWNSGHLPCCFPRAWGESTAREQRSHRVNSSHWALHLAGGGAAPPGAHTWESAQQASPPDDQLEEEMGRASSWPRTWFQFLVSELEIIIYGERRSWLIFLTQSTHTATLHWKNDYKE